jgi:four helix bundle protein
MAKIERFEELEAWQRARELSKAIYAISGKGKFFRDFGLREQIRRASVSVMSNIAEGFDRGGNRELIQFLFIAKGSAAEIQTQLYVALDNEYITKEEFQKLFDLAINASRIIGGLIRYLKSYATQSSTRNSQRATRNEKYNSTPKHNNGKTQINK